MMLDEVLAHPNWGHLVQRIPPLESLRAVHAFVLSSDAQLAVEHLTGTAASPATLTGQFRLPYPHTWVEARLRSGKHIGLYMLDAQGSCFVVAFARNDRHQLGVVTAGVFDPSSLTLGTGHCWTVASTPMAEFESRSENALDAVADFAVMGMAAVAIINSRAVSYTEPSELARLNRARERRGKPPLIEYHTVPIRDEVSRHLRQIDRGDAEGVRLHWRRGHFKARKSGLYWWNPHLAGKKELGFVQKDYVA